MLKKLILILILILTQVSINAVFAQTQTGGVEYDGYYYTFEPGSAKKFLSNANRNYALFEHAQTPIDKNFYIHEAMRYYFLLSQADKTSLEANIGLGRVYDAMKLDSYAKKHLFTSLNLAYTNPRPNFYFANFYYDRGDLINAQYYYMRAYNYGYSKRPDLNYRLGVIYEKLADIESAIKYYRKAATLGCKEADLYDKIQMLGGLNYNESQYYLFSPNNK